MSTIMNIHAINTFAIRSYPEASDTSLFTAGTVADCMFSAPQFWNPFAAAGHARQQLSLSQPTEKPTKI